VDEQELQRANIIYYIGLTLQSIFILGSLYADVSGFMIGVPWQYIAITAFVLFLFQTIWKIYQLQRFALSLATNVKLNNVRFKEIGLISQGSVLLSPKGETIKARSAHFVMAVFRNEPKYGTENNHANKVWASISYFDIKGNLLIGPIDGRWSGSDHPKTRNDIDGLLRRQISSDGSNVTLDIAMKPHHQNSWYAYNNNNYFFDNMIDDTRQLKTNVVNVKINLSGERVKKTFWVRINNMNNGGIQIEKRNFITRRLP